MHTPAVQLLTNGCMRLTRVQGVACQAWRTRPVCSSRRTPPSIRCLSGTAEQSSRKSWDIKMLYDGDCPLCMREVDMLKRRDQGKGRIAFVDIASPAYSPTDNQNISFEEAMGNIHGIMPDGKVITNVEVFRRLYEAVGLGWVYAITKFGPVGSVAEFVYGIWAKYRLPVTGRPDLETVLRQKKSCSTDQISSSS